MTFLIFTKSQLTKYAYLDRNRRYNIHPCIVVVKNNYRKIHID